MKRLAAVCFGEFLGVLLLVFLGTSAVAVAVIFKAFSGLMEVAIIWGLAVTLAIYGTRHQSCAHLNPAASLGMVVAGRMDPRLLPWYLAAQTVGGIAGGVLVLLLFNGQIAQFEAAHGILRGSPESIKTAMMFGEYFPNPGMAPEWLDVSMGTAALAEAIGTFILVTMIFLLTEGCNVGRPADGLAPVFIGGTVAVIIGVLAPLTQAGLNPARDFGPRMVAFVAGWGEIAIPGPRGGSFIVYVLGPLLGGITAALCFRFLIMRLMQERSRALGCVCDPAAGTAGPKIPDSL